MKFSVILTLVYLVLALKAQGPSAQDNSNGTTKEDDYMYFMSGSGLSEVESLDTVMLTTSETATVTPTSTRNMIQAISRAATTTVDIITAINSGAAMDTPTSTVSGTTTAYNTNVMMPSQVSVHTVATVAATTATTSMADTTGSGPPPTRSMADTTATRSPPTIPTSTNITTPTNTKPTVPANTNSRRSSGITSAGFGIGWIIGFVIGVLLTFIIETSFFLYWRNKRRRYTHPSTKGQGGEYFEMSSEMMKHCSESPPEDNGGQTPDVKRPLIEP